MSNFKSSVMPSEALCEHAKILELSESKRISCNPDFVKILEPMLLGVYCLVQPTPSDYENRWLIVKAFNMIVRDIFGNRNGFPVVEAFGSFMMNIFTAASDLDLSINFSHDVAAIFHRPKKISLLRRFIKTLYNFQSKGRVAKVSPVLQARIPIVKVVDPGTGIECDISIENKEGRSRSLFFYFVSSIDERFRILSFLMKIWAKVHNINSSKDHTMNSLTIVSLVAFHLQTRTPPILPPFSSLLKDGTDMSNVENIALGLKDFGKRNEESVAMLFRTLLNKLLSVEELWNRGLCASTFEGAWVAKTLELNSKNNNMIVEDFLDRSENFARAVGKAEVQKIYSCIRTSQRHIELFLQHQIEVTFLKELLFGSVMSGTKVEDDTKINYKRKRCDGSTGLLEFKRVGLDESVIPPTRHFEDSSTAKSSKKDKKKKNKKMVQDNAVAEQNQLPRKNEQAQSSFANKKSCDSKAGESMPQMNKPPGQSSIPSSAEQSQSSDARRPVANEKPCHTKAGVVMQQTGKRQRQSSMPSSSVELSQSYLSRMPVANKKLRHIEGTVAQNIRGPYGQSSMQSSTSSNPLVHSRQVQHPLRYNNHGTHNFVNHFTPQQRNYVSWIQPQFFDLQSSFGQHLLPLPLFPHIGCVSRHQLNPGNVLNGYNQHALLFPTTHLSTSPPALYLPRGHRH